MGADADQEELERELINRHRPTSAPMSGPGNQRRFCHVRSWSACPPIADEFEARADFPTLMSVVKRKAGVSMGPAYVGEGPQSGPVSLRLQCSREVGGIAGVHSADLHRYRPALWRSYKRDGQHKLSPRRKRAYNEVCVQLPYK